MAERDAVVLSAGIDFLAAVVFSAEAVFFAVAVFFPDACLAADFFTDAAAATGLA